MLVEDQVGVRPDIDVAAGSRMRKMAIGLSENDIAVELGIWFSGIESFLASGHHSFATGNSRADASREFRLIHSALRHCSALLARLQSASSFDRSMLPPVDSFSATLREITMLSEALIRSNNLGAGEWKAWSSLLTFQLSGLPIFTSLIQYAEEAGETYLPRELAKVAESEDFLSPEHAEIALILPRFGRILKWLSVIGKMLETDEPLKPALLVFARVNEQIFELTTYINSRLERFPDEEAELFSMLDAASYTASIELKKVYTQELAGIASMRPSPSIYARMETAHSLLNESFQQILAGLASIMDPKANVFKLFPNFSRKRESSIVLRRDLASVIEAVQAAETSPEKPKIDKLQNVLRKFMDGSVRFLFYKDTETVERFVEEILITKPNKDLVPILHRFGAFLETLLGQVALRAVLEHKPTDQ